MADFTGRRPSDQQMYLREGLAFDYFTLYHSSPSFKSAIDMLAQMLPFMVDGLAMEADKQDAQQQAFLKALEEIPFKIHLGTDPLG